MTEQEIYSLVSLTLNDWLVDGEFSEDYKRMAAQAIELREQMDRETAMADVSPIVDINGTSITSRHQAVRIWPCGRNQKNCSTASSEVWLTTANNNYQNDC